MTATASRRAASLPLEEQDDFWGQAPAAVSQPSHRDEAHAPYGPAAEQARRRVHVAANDADADPAAGRRRAFQQPDVIAPWQRSAPSMPLRPGSATLNRVAIAAALGVVAMLAIGTAVLTFNGEPADGPATPVVLSGDAPEGARAVETDAAQATETGTTAAGADAATRKMQALMEAAEFRPVTEAAAAEPTAALSESNNAGTRPDAAAAAGADTQPLPAASAEPTPLAGPDAEEAAGEASALPDEMATAALRPVDEAAPLAPAGQDASEDLVRLTPAETAPQVAAGTEETDAATAPSEIELLADAATKTTVKKWVNMRSGPADDAASITVIPADAEVGVISCDGWCQVIYEGEQGWVYKSFVRDAEKLTAKNG